MQVYHKRKQLLELDSSSAAFLLRELKRNSECRYSVDNEKITLRNKAAKQLAVNEFGD